MVGLNVPIVYFRICFKYILVVCFFAFLTQPVQSQEEISNLHRLIAENPDPDSLISLYKEVSIAYYRIDSMDKAIEYGQKGLNLAEKIENHTGKADMFNNLGVMFKEKGWFTLAIENYFESLKIKESLGDQAGIISSYNNIGVVYNLILLPDSALDYFNQCHDYYSESGDSVKLATINLNMGASFYLNGLHSMALEKYYEAFSYYMDKSDSSKIYSLYLNIGEAYEALHEYDSSRTFYERAIDLKGKNMSQYMRVCWYMGKFLYNQGQENEAYMYLIQAFTIAEKLQSLSTLSDVSEKLTEYFRTSGLLDSALYYSDLHILFKDSLNLLESRSKLVEFEMTSDYIKQITIQNEVLRRQKLMKNAYLAATALFLVIAFFIYRNYRIKQKANKLLAEMDELKSHLYSNISHEFRTPLTLILGPLEQMLAEETGKTPTQKTVKMMQRNANRLLELVNQMLDLSKVEAGNMKLELMEVDILKSIRIYISSFSSLAEKKEIQYEQIVPAGALITWYDADKLEKILTNLLSNAFKFTPDGGTVSTEVTVSKSNDRIQISLKDTGKGISKDQLDKIFDRFHQVEEQGDPDRIGTGIGLALTKELVDLMHGEIKVDSTLGVGTSFTISIPLGKNHLGEDEFVLVENRLPKSARDNKAMDESSDISFEGELEDELLEDSKYPVVLTVEDHSDIRVHIKENLEDCYQMIEASDGEMGLSKAIECIPDLVITDLMMPKMDGVEMCKKLKTDERTSHIPVIMLTAKAGIEDRIEGLETGADAYVTKPFNIKELRVRVKNLIEQRKKLRERFSKDIKLEPKDIAITSADETFLNRALEIIENQMENSEFEVRDFQDEMGMSRMQLFRKIKALTDYSPSEFIRNLRLKRAAQLMEKNYGNVAQITYKVGFNNLSYFAKCFKDLFEISPSEYLKKHAQ